MNPQQLPVPMQRLAAAMEKLIDTDRPRYRRLWAYYRNPMRPLDVRGDERPYRQAQEWGLPSRITGFRSTSGDTQIAQRVDDVRRKEVVIENDIAWRLDTMVEYLFGKSIVVLSAAPDETRRAQISELLRQILAGNGGMIFLQQLALLSAVYGYVDVLVKLDPARVAALDRDGDCDDHSQHSCLDTQSLGRAPAGTMHELSAGPTVGPAQEASDRRALPSPQPLEAGASSDAVPAVSDGSTPPTPAADSLAESIDRSKEHQARICAEAASRLARLVRFEMIEPARALPFLSASDYRVVETYGQVFNVDKTSSTPTKPNAQRWAWNLFKSKSDQTVQVVELLTASHWYRLENGKLIASGTNSLGQIPLVHVQNLSVPFEYSGTSEVEPLIPLQDELNTRLSDRAHRITLQSFKMYLGKNIDGFVDRPVAPGRMWATDNPDAEILEFGGDTACPSEESHIAEVREALDKASGVSPVAAGGVKNKLGRLTSAAALRVTMQSLLSKTEKKRISFGLAIGRMCELALAWLDAAGVFATTADERRVEIHWPNPLPISDTDALAEAQAKLKLGIPADVVTRELGY